VEREADHSPPSRDEVKNVRRYTSTLPILRHGVVLSQSTGKTLPFKKHNVHMKYFDLECT
jgi:hypothetical protein